MIAIGDNKNQLNTTEETLSCELDNLPKWQSDYIAFINYPIIFIWNSKTMFIFAIPIPN